METKRFGNTIAVRLERGEEICASMLAVCREYGVRAGMIQGLGAAKGVTIGLFDAATKAYSETVLNDFLEITNLTGNVSVMEDACYLHLHITLANETGAAFGGHLKSAVIGATAEIFITVLDGEIRRVHDDATGLNLFSFR